ncbi:MAG: SRPBCC domain-containing protein [Candidatus Lokiarchaeota archaeon]|nr:SRPBCC domain-containing protein [Candidatus Lokiarchaeota archaeon]
MENIILIKEEIDCDVKSAFSMFTNNELLENWLTVKANVEPTVGGKYELFWAPDHPENDSTIGCKITGIETNKFISFEWKGPVEFKSLMNFVDPLTHVIVFFSHNNSPKKTIIHLFHTGWRNGSDWQKAREYFQKAWFNALLGLKEKIKNNELS